MNLFDVVHRKDSFCKFVAGTLETSVDIIDGVKNKAVNFSSDCRLVLNSADQIQSLCTRPHKLDWRVTVGRKGFFRIFYRGDRNVALFESGPTSDPIEVTLDWPFTASEFSIEFESSGDIKLLVGENYNPRQKLLEDLRGRGLEIGPGVNPLIKQNARIDISYLEAEDRNSWAEKYSKDPTFKGMEGIWEKYAEGFAHSFEIFPNEEFDFIFSNHVFEHLKNPIGVLLYWMKKLKMSDFTKFDHPNFTQLTTLISRV